MAMQDLTTCVCKRDHVRTSTWTWRADRLTTVEHVPEHPVWEGQVRLACPLLLIKPAKGLVETPAVAVLEKHDTVDGCGRVGRRGFVKSWGPPYSYDWRGQHLHDVHCIAEYLLSSV
jgi:hypothetical protein